MKCSRTVPRGHSPQKIPALHVLPDVHRRIQRLKCGVHSVAVQRKNGATREDSRIEDTSRRGCVDGGAQGKIQVDTAVPALPRVGRWTKRIDHRDG